MLPEMAVSCHVVVGASVKDGEIEPVFFSSFCLLLCMKLAGYDRDAHVVKRGRPTRS